MYQTVERAENAEMDIEDIYGESQSLHHLLFLVQSQRLASASSAEKS